MLHRILIRIRESFSRYILFKHLSEFMDDWESVTLATRIMKVVYSLWVEMDMFVIGTSERVLYFISLPVNYQLNGLFKLCELILTNQLLLVLTK